MSPFHNPVVILSAGEARLQTVPGEGSQEILRPLPHRTQNDVLKRVRFNRVSSYHKPSSVDNHPRGLLEYAPLMKKEVILAIVIGFAIGLLITFGIYTARRALENTPSSTPSPSPVATGSSEEKSSLTITTPVNEALVDTATIPLEGSATPEAIITIITPEGQQIITADETGAFATEIELTGGANEINVSAFTPSGVKTEVVLTVVYSTAKI